MNQPIPKTAASKLLFILCLFAISCHSQSKNCSSLPSSFTSYSEAYKQIQSTSFQFQDNLPEGKSSWIKKATFKSCDGVVGYMLYTTSGGKDYAHSGVPIDVWNEFKNAPSSGSYYDHNIRHRYRLVTE